MDITFQDLVTVSTMVGGPEVAEDLGLATVQDVTETSSIVLGFAVDEGKVSGGTAFVIGDRVGRDFCGCHFGAGCCCGCGKDDECDCTREEKTGAHCLSCWNE